MSLLGRHGAARPTMPQMSQNNLLQMIQQFQQFRSQMTPDGARAKIEELRKTGQMSDEQFRTLSDQAQSIMSMLHR